MIERSQKAALIDYLANNGEFQQGAIEAYLDFIGAPDELVQFIPIAGEMYELFPIIDEVLRRSTGHDLELSLEDVAEWTAINSWVHEHAERLSHDIFKGEVWGDGNPFRGHIEEWPIYISIYYRHPEESLCAPVNQLRAQFLIAQYQLRFLQDDQHKNYTNTIKESSRLIRLCSDGPKGKRFSERQDFVRLLPRNSLGMSKFWSSLEEDLEVDLEENTERDDVAKNSKGFYEKGDQADRKTQECLHIIRRLVTYCLEELGGFTRNRSDAWRAALLRQPIVEDMEDVDEGEVNAPTLTRFIMPSQSEKSEREARQIGCNPEEISSGVELVRVNLDKNDDPNNKYLDQSPRSQLMRSRGAVKAIKIKNQLISNRWNRLSKHEISVFLSALKDIEKKGNEFQFHNEVTNLELASVLTSCFWLSSSIERIVTSKAIIKSDQLTANSSNCLLFDIDTCSWLISVEGAKYKIPIKKQFDGFIDESSKQVFISNVYDQFNVINTWCSFNCIRPSKHRAKPLFILEPNVYIEAAQKFISSLNTKFRTRLSKKRISDEMFYRVFDACGDLVESTYIFNRKHYLSKVQEYYAAPKKEYLENLYEKVCKKTMEELQGERIEIDFNYKKSRSIKNNSINIRVGARHVISKNRISCFVENLWLRFLKSTNLVGLDDYLIELHNDYTLYVIELIAFCTAYRAVIDPLPDLDLLDKKTGFLCISDKDGDDYYNSRLVWLPEIALSQIELYQTHRIIISQRLVLSNPSAAKRIKENDKNIPFLFFLTKNYRPTSARPYLIRERVKSFFPLPVNANRSYLRNCLREKGVSGEIVDYFMSHWDRGQEPFSSDSAFSPMDYVAAISNPLTNILTTDGWKAIPGLR